ncbi:MAG: hypothetical protein M3N93_09275 [Acidobacteriota bacterium]|nr:hypothetical protein [Acidobacteriota bacterium]
MSFLDNLENNLKALENRDEGGIDESRRRDADRARALAVAPWAERLKSSPFTAALMQQATVAGRERRIKVNLIWLGTTLRLEARDRRLEFRPEPDSVVAVFLNEGDELRRETVNLDASPEPLITSWMTTF